MPKKASCHLFWEDLKSKMVHKRGKCGLNTGATLRLRGWGNISGQLAAEQHCIIVTKKPAKEPSVMTKGKKVIDLQEKVNIDDGKLELQVPDEFYPILYSVNKRKRWTVADAVESYIDDHAEDASRVVLVKREAEFCMGDLYFRVIKETDCTSFHDSKTPIRHMIPSCRTHGSTETDLRYKAVGFDPDALQREVKFPRRAIHNQHARGVQRRIHHPECGYSSAKRTAMREHLEKWKSENVSNLGDKVDTIKYEVLKPKKASAELHNWFHKHVDLEKDHDKDEYYGSPRLRSNSSRTGTKTGAYKFMEKLSDFTGTSPSDHIMNDEYEDLFFDDYMEEEEFDDDLDMYISGARACRTIGDELFDLVSNAEQNKKSMCKESKMAAEDEEVFKEFVDLDIAGENSNTNAVSDGTPKPCRDVHPNALMASPTRWYPKGQVFFQPENHNSKSDPEDKKTNVCLEKKRNLSHENKKRNRKERISRDSLDSGISEGSTSSLESLNTCRPTTPVHFSCSVPFSDIQPISLSETFRDCYTEGHSLPRRFTVQISGSAMESGEVFVLFETKDSGALDFNTWGELDELFTEVKFQVLGDFKEYMTMEVMKKIGEKFGGDMEMPLTGVIDRVADVLQSLPSDSFAQPELFEVKTKTSSGTKCMLQTLGAVNEWKQEILTLPDAFDLVDQRAKSAFIEHLEKFDKSEPADDGDVCGICYEPVVMFTGCEAVHATTLTTCSHVFCDDCWFSHLTSRIKQGDVQLACPGYNCKAMIDFPTLMSLLPWKLFKLHRQHVRDALIERSCDLAWCPWEKCSRVVRSWKPSRKGGGENVVCECGDTWCFHCHQRPHWPATCKQAADYSRALYENGDDKLDMSRSFIVEGKRCPHCSHPIEKNGGCPYMFCTRCSNSFCWTCGRALSDNHFACSPTQYETFAMIDHYPGRKRFYLLALTKRIERLKKNSLCRIVKNKKTKSVSIFQVMRNFRRNAHYLETKSLWIELNYTLEYSYVVMYHANRKRRSQKIPAYLSFVSVMMEELRDLVTAYACHQFKLAEYVRRLESIKNRANMVLKPLRRHLQNQQWLIAKQ